MVRTRSKPLSLCVLFAMIFLHTAGNSLVASPYVVEIYMAEQSCNDVLNLEDSIEYMNTTLLDDPDAIVVRCQIPHEADIENERARWLCRNRLGNYKNTLPRTVLGSRPIHNFGIILNGRYVDSGRLSAKLLDAVAMAKSLKELKPVNLSYENQVLEIEFPELEFNKKPFAQIIALNEGEEIVYVDFRNGGERVVHPKKVATNGRIVRNWDGSAMSLSVPVDDMPAQSYAVLVNSTDGGHLIAAGQVSTTKETLKTSSLEQ